MRVFGSYYNNLYLPNSDIDLVMLWPNQDQNEIINSVEKLMLKNPQIFSEIEAIKKTKVPIIKFSEKEF